MHGQHNRCQQMLLFQYAWTAWHIIPPAQSAKMTRAEARRQWRKRQKAWKLSSPTVSNHCLLDWQVKGMVDSKEEFAIFVERTFLHDLHFILVCFSLFWHALSCILRTQVSKNARISFCRCHLGMESKYWQSTKWPDRPKPTGRSFGQPGNWVGGLLNRWTHWTFNFANGIHSFTAKNFFLDVPIFKHHVETCASFIR